MSSSRKAEVTQHDGVTVIALGPDFENLDEWDLDEVRTLLLDEASKASPPVVVLDLSHTKFFGSSFIEILFRVWNRLKSTEGGRFAISGLTPYCAEVLEVTHLNQLWDVYPTKEDAVADLAAGK